VIYHAQVRLYCLKNSMKESKKGRHLMRVSTINTNLLRVETQEEQTEKQKINVGNSSWRELLAASAIRKLVAKRGVQVSQRYSKNRAARIEALKAQVEAGTYHVDSFVLAERLLINDTHFLDEV
jgi:anti-sigma28 factor (negative regulator of flagellin synthesis)